MAIDTGVRRSRRALLAGGIGGLAAVAAAAIGRPLPVRAANGDAVVVGGEYAAISVTSFNTGGSGETALLGHSDQYTGAGVGGTSYSAFGVYGCSFSGVGVCGESAATKPPILGLSHGDSAGVQGYSGYGGGYYSRDLSTVPAAPAMTGVYGYATGDASAVGVRGESVDGKGVVGESSSNAGVHGFSDTGPGIYGNSNSADGVHGTSGSNAGVYGESTSGAGLSGESVSEMGVFGMGVVGVYGWSDAKAGVIGLATVLPEDVAYPAKTGVYGYAPADSACRGVWGQATSGTGVYATATTGYALRAVGRVRLDKCVGVATIAAGKNSVNVKPGVDLDTTSAVVATLQGSAGGTTTVHRCSVNTTTNTFSIFLTANATTAVKVAWHVFG